MRHATTAVLLAGSALLSPARGQEEATVPRPVTIPGSEVHPLHSDHVDQDFELWVARPLPGFRPAPGPPGVLYVLDANLLFATAVETTRLMHRLYGELPPLLVVGIAYPGEDFFLHGELRTRDFTPTFDRDAAARPRPTDRPPVLPAEQSMGGAERFRAFLLEEVRPFVEEHYEVAAGADTLFGASFGGLFAAHTLLTAPGSFARYLIVSPALWWDKEHLFAVEEARAETGADLVARVFLAVGAMEEGPEFLAPYKMVGNTQRLADQLRSRQYPSLGIEAHVFADETHTSVMAVALTRGLRALLAGRGR